MVSAYLDHLGVERGLAATGFEEVGLLSLSSADHSEIADITKGLADRYEGTQTGLSLPSTRVDAFNIDLANELTRNGHYQLTSNIDLDPLGWVALIALCLVPLVACLAVGRVEAVRPS